MYRLTLKKMFGGILFLFLCFSCKQEDKKETTANLKQLQDTPETVKPKPISKDEENVLKKLINEEIEKYGENNDASIDFKEYPYSLSITDEAESRSIIYFSVFASGDLNGDGVTDYIVSETSDGMAGSSFVFVIMKDKINIAETHEVLTYAPFSYNVLDEPKYKEGKFKITAFKNDRVYDEDSDESANLVFLYKDDNLYESSYLSECELAKLESKTIFNEMPNIIKRKRSVDLHNYTETIEETYRTKDTIIHASLSGCDNPKFEFHAIIPATKNQIRDVVFIKNITVSILTFLADNTQFSEDISPIVEYYDENNVTDKEIVTDDNLVFTVFARKEDYDEKEKELSIRIIIERRNNSNQIENWEITTRK